MSKCHTTPINFYLESVLDIQLANALWKRILPLDEDGSQERPIWMVQIVGEHQYPRSLQEYSEISHEVPEHRVGEIFIFQE